MSEMRRKDREMDKDFAYAVIDKAEFGNIALVRDDGTPYCIPVSPARIDDKIYIHSACCGSKIDAVKANPKVCMTFVGDVKVPPALTKEEIAENPAILKQLGSKKFTTEFESAVVFGTATVVKDPAEKILGLRMISEKYVPGNMPYFDTAVKDSLSVTCVIRIDIENITAKRKKL